MGKKIFISYKYADGKVLQLNNGNRLEKTTVRDYVDILQDFIDKSDHINKGENDNEDMDSLADTTIGSKLGDKIFDSSVTIVFISKGMKESNKSDKVQWIPWEIAYSLKEQSRNGERSKTNAVLAVVLPDENGRYEYFITNNSCSRNLNTDFLFDILKGNMFNKKTPDKYSCPTCNGTHYQGEYSYISAVKWDDFKSNANTYINKAVKIKEDINNYELRKHV